MLRTTPEENLAMIADTIRYLKDHRKFVIYDAEHSFDGFNDDPDYAQAHSNLAAMLQLAGRGGEAVEHYRRAIALRPDNLEARANLGQLLSSSGEEGAAAAEFRRVLAMRADYPQALAGLAWLEATSSDRLLRNTEEAVRLAERAAGVTNRRDLLVLDALAVAYAAAGRFDEAARTAAEAAAAAQADGRMELARRFRERAARYSQGRP